MGGLACCSSGELVEAVGGAFVILLVQLKTGMNKMSGDLPLLAEGGDQG